MSMQKLATRHWCVHKRNPAAGLQHTQGNGKPTRKRCRWCGGELVTQTGQWGVFAWTGTGRYPADEAESTYLSERAADRRTDKLALRDIAQPLNAPEGGWVVRWIPMETGS